MKLAIISFTKQGNQLNQMLSRGLREQGEDCMGYVPDRFAALAECAGLTSIKGTLTEWVAEQFPQMDGFVWIGAAGIAVRAIAPCIKDKMTDPAVVVTDEKGRFAISLLSGHVGGANELAECIAQMSGGQAVITTATDVNDRFAVDLFAKKHGLLWTDRALAKQISADILEGVPVGFHSDFPVEGELPEGLVKGLSCQRGIWITCQRQAGNAGVLRLVPKALILGIGCRKGTSKQAIRTLVEQVLVEANLDAEAIRSLASIDLKKQEPGLLALAEELGVELHTYSTEELCRVPGDYTDSAFVEETTGVGNVCERAAVLAAMQQGSSHVDCLVVRKHSGDGVTVAAAIRDWKVMI